MVTRSPDIHDGVVPVGLSKTETTMSKRASPTVLSGEANVAVKVIRDVSRQSLRRFWFEVLIMKVREDDTI